MGNLLQDLRYGARTLLKNPGFTLIAVLMRSLPFHDPDRLVMVWEDASFAGFPRNTPAPANYADWKSQNHVFEDMGALAINSFNLTGDGEPEKIDSCEVTANFFSMLGVKPALGRGFLPGEDMPGVRVTVLSYGL